LASDWLALAAHAGGEAVMAVRWVELVAIALVIAALAVLLIRAGRR
jgi:hypothetical protein